MRKTIALISFVLFLTSIVAFGNGEATVRWPVGRYGLPNTIYGCPVADDLTWATGNITQALGPNSKASSSFHLKVSVTTKGVQRSFCVKNTGSLDSARPAWPAGQYCIYRKGGKCPAGLKAGSLTWNNRFVLNYAKNTGVVPDGRSTSSNTLIHFCCAMNGNKNTPIPLPLESPFFLLAYQSTKCQQVQGALHTAEFIYYNTDGPNNLNNPPYPYGASSYNMNITYCYYQTCRNNLTALNGTIMSPFYPSNYPSNADCRWQIQVPDDYAITLEFEDFDTEWSASCTKDWLQVSTGSPETVVSKYCAKRVYPPLETRSNVVILDFHSDGVTSLNKGFTVHYRARKIPVSMTTTSQPTVTTTTRSTTTTKTTSSISPTNAPTTSLPTQTTTEPKPDKSTQSTSPATQQPTVTTTEGSESQGTSPLTDISRSSPPATPAIRGARKENSGQRVWVIPVVVGLSLLCVTALLIVLYFKCLKKRNTIRRRNSTVKYNRKCSYVDMEIQSDEAFGITSNPSAVLYDNYPGEGSASGYSEPKPTVVQAPVYEEIKDPTGSEKCQRNNVYESMPTMNDYQTPPQRTPREAHVYESATFPLKK